MKRKFKLPILAKIAFLGIIAAGATMSISLIVSYNLQLQAEKDRVMEDVDRSLSSINYQYSEDYGRSNLINSLSNIIEKAVANYEADTDKIDALKFPNFETYFDKYQHLGDYGTWFYPLESEMGLSQDKLNLIVQNSQLNTILTSSTYYCSADSTFAAVYKHTNASEGLPQKNELIFLGDSRYKAKMGPNDFAFLAGSFTELGQDQVLPCERDKIFSLSFKNYVTKGVCIFDDDAPLCMFFIKYNFNRAYELVYRSLNQMVMIALITSAVTILIVSLGSYFMFTRNIIKLKNTATKVGEKLSNPNEFEMVDINIRSHDEIKTLTDSFMAMEEKIYDYSDIVRRNAAEKERANAELKVASAIQLESLPLNSYHDDKFHVEAFIRTAKEVGGDFYDYFYVGDKFVVLISDVSGKGIPASLFMMRGKEIIKSMITSSTKSLGEIIKDVNNSLIKNNNESLFITSFIGIIDFKKHTMNYVNAGHEKPYIISGDKITKIDGISNFVLGGLEDINYVEESVEFNEGDELFLFTDGLNESIDNSYNEFGYQNIEKCLQNSIKFPLKDKISYIDSELKAFTKAEELFDDVTMLLVKLNKDNLHLSYEQKDYSIITDITDKFNDEFAYLPADVKSRVGIVIDELINNLVSYEKRNDLRIEVDFILSGKKLKIEISSNGEDYNPFDSYKEKYITEEPTATGGFGIGLVKTVASSASYKYKDDKSVITLQFDIKP